jgi:RimJ/RimL family protein N-acetyltransferase
MAAKIGPNYSKFLKEKLAEGYHPQQIPVLPGAMAAFQADQEGEAQADSKRTKSEWLARIPEDQRRFNSQAEFLEAIRDQQYAKSAEYRAAVEEMAANTDPSVLGVSGHAQDQYGRKVQIGRDGLSEKSDANSMLRNAYREMVMEKLQKFPDTAEGRYQKLVFLTDPTNAEAIAEIERMTMTPEQLRRNQMLAAQDGQGALQIQLGTDKQAGSSGVVFPEHGRDIITREDGTVGFRDGSPLPA